MDAVVNGHCERTPETRLGRLGLKMPKLHSGSYFPSFSEPRKASEQALVAVDFAILALHSVV
ncbi:MAG TPA: hypothetical protein ENJ98_00730 [Thiolapillus brandeum]|uniref:Uncharacterized protein n=1 Tax=Thiolapillus brandeum TaxID=1076588 RepID=A0A7C5MW27_9GAMM|nr:hypothetical protein [Thiolapillus brandeum]